MDNEIHLKSNDEESHSDVQLTCTKPILDIFKGTFEIEIMQGDVKELPDGRYSVQFSTEGFKTELIKRFVFSMMNPGTTAN